jgi:surface antigen
MRGEERLRWSGARPLGQVGRWKDADASDGGVDDGDVARHHTRYLPAQARRSGAQGEPPRMPLAAREPPPLVMGPATHGRDGWTPGRRTGTGAAVRSADLRTTGVRATSAQRTAQVAAIPHITHSFPTVASTWTTAKPPAAAATRPHRVPARLPSVLDDRQVAQGPAVDSARALEAFCAADTSKPRALPRGTTLVPAVPRVPVAQGTGLSQILADLDRTHARLRIRRPRALRQALTTAGAMTFAVLAVLGVMLLRAPSMQQAHNYALLTDSTGSQLGALYAAPTQMQSTPTGSSPWQADARSVPVLGGGGASAPAADTTQAATATTAPVPTSTTAAQPALPQPTATPQPQPTATPQPQPTATSQPQPTATPKPQPTATPQPQPTATPVPVTGILAAPVYPWPPANAWMSVPGHSPYAMGDYPGDPMASAFGQCTWWAQYERRDENLRGMGNARYWAANASGRGLRVGTAPQVGATVVFQPGVQGAGWAGHVAHVLALYPGGWFLVSEMNSYGNGGGWGRVSFRYVHTGAGVQFIY